VFFFSSQSELYESFKIALNGWKKADPPKIPLLFWTCKHRYNVKS